MMHERAIGLCVAVTLGCGRSPGHDLTPDGGLIIDAGFVTDAPRARDGGLPCLRGATQPCYSGPPGTSGRGPCRDGARECIGDDTGTSWSECTGEVTPTVELCENGIDEDCSGTVDDGPGCAPDAAVSDAAIADAAIADVVGADAAPVPGTCTWVSVETCMTGAPIADFCGAGFVGQLRSCNGTIYMPDPTYLEHQLCSCSCPGPSCVVWSQVECCTAPQAPDAGPVPDAGPAPSCVGTYDEGWVYPWCPVMDQVCAPGGSCMGSTGTASFTTCSETECAGSLTGEGSFRCNAGVTCALALGPVGPLCAECGAGATCDITGNVAGSERFTCEAGSSCTINLLSSGGIDVACGAGAVCRLGGSHTGPLRVTCAGDCLAETTGSTGDGHTQVCCASGTPTACTPYNDVYVCGDTACP